MVRVLAIGNSFSQDAAAYLHDIAAADNVEMKVVNLYIGGCSLQTHWANTENDNVCYQYELNGRVTDRIVSIREALQEDNWDFVILQQVSSDSGVIDSYYPYIKNLSSYVKRSAPQAKQLIHQTWAYEKDSAHGAFIKYDCDQQKMYEALTKAYLYVANDMNLSIIPSGDVIQKLRETDLFDYDRGGLSLCRDGFHMSLIFGRYAVGATWYEIITGNSIINNRFIPPLAKKSDERYIQVIKRCVSDVCSRNS